MAKIVDPDLLTLDITGSPSTEEVAIETDAKTIELRIAGDLDDDSPGSLSGITLQCLYSFLKEEWRTNTTLNKFKFPIKAIYEAKFVMQYGWSWANQQTRDLIRDAGWQEITGAEHACLISLGTQVAASQAWYQQVAGFDITADNSVSNFDKTAALDEAVEIFDGGSNDYRDYLKLFLRRWEYTYSDYEILSEQGFSALTYIAYRAPLANANDIKNDGTVTQGTIQGANDPYQDMEIQYYPGNLFETVADQAYTIDDVVLEDNGAGSRWWICTTAGTVSGTTGVAKASWTLGTSVWIAFQGEREIETGVYSAFNREIQYNGAATKPTKEQIYLFAQDALLSTADINDDPETESYGAVYGRIAVRLAYWVGDVLNSWPGTNFINFNTNDTNDLVLNDIQVDGGLDSEGIPVESDARTYPFTAAGTIVFSENLVDEADAETHFHMYHAYTQIQTDQTNFTITGPSGADATLVGTGMTLSAGDYFILSGFTTNTANNGVKVATGTPTSTSVDYTDALGVTQVADVTGEAVTLKENPFDTETAEEVTDNSATAIQGLITQVNEAFDFNYDGNTDGGRTAATDAPVVIVAQALDGAEWVFAEFTITRTTGLNFPVNAPDELTYLNP